jgi:hypothetical protein
VAGDFRIKVKSSHDDSVSGVECYCLLRRRFGALVTFVVVGAGRDASGTKAKPFSLIFNLLRPRLEGSPSLALDGAGRDASGTKLASICEIGSF